MECKCMRCGKEYIYKRSTGCGMKYCNSCTTKIRRILTKNILISLLGGSCLICNFKDCKSALEFHHVISKDKEFSFSGKTVSWKKIKPEIEKCVLLCSNCHRRVHHNCIVNNCDCTDQLVITNIPIYNLPDKSPFTLKEQTGISRKPLYKRIYGSREDAVVAQRKVYLEKINQLLKKY